LILVTAKSKKKTRINRYYPTSISIGISEQQFQSRCFKGLLYYYCGSRISPVLSMLYLCAYYLTWRTTQFLGGEVIFICCSSLLLFSLLHQIEWLLNCMKYNILTHIEMTILLFPLLKQYVSHLVIPWSWHAICKW